MQIDAAAAVLPPKSRGQSRSRAPEFPGCRPIPLKREELSGYDGRFEYWDGNTETAWVVSEPTSATHEQPSTRLAGLGHVIAGVRGAPIECFGTMDLLLRNAQGEKWRIMQADQTVYLHPWRARLPTDAMEIGHHHRPDVVPEVDRTTGVRRGKLWLYESRGFPEVWVDVPEAEYAVRRSAGLSPGLTIHLLDDDGAWRTAARSRAFPGWTADEIHTALNEAALSVETSRVLRRVGGALGERQAPDPTTHPGCAWNARSRRPKGNGRCRSARRHGGSEPGRRSGCPRCSVASRTPGDWPRRATGWSTAKPAPS